MLELPRPRNELHLDLAVLEFSASERKRVQVAAAWVPRRRNCCAAAATPIQLNNVPGGNFMLEAIGINGDGTESGLEEMLRITVVRPFWTRNWFIAFVITVFIVLIAWFWARAYCRRMQRMLEDAGARNEGLAHAHPTGQGHPSTMTWVAAPGRMAAAIAVAQAAYGQRCTLLRS
ncbi:MAG: hypothetical protein IPM46_01235 [Flavobacteriales bacterium]|nr:hypothetical protein [Flavobacteriales bacterium]